MILHTQEDVNRSLLDWPSPPSLPSPSDMAGWITPTPILTENTEHEDPNVCSTSLEENSQLNIDNCTHEGNNSSMNKLWIKDCFRDESSEEFIDQYGSHSSPLFPTCLLESPCNDMEPLVNDMCETLVASTAGYCTPDKRNQPSLSEFRRENNPTYLLRGSPIRSSNEELGGSYINRPGTPHPIAYQNPIQIALRRMHMKNVLGIVPKRLSFSSTDEPSEQFDSSATSEYSEQLDIAFLESHSDIENFSDISSQNSCSHQKEESIDENYDGDQSHSNSPHYSDISESSPITLPSPSTLWQEQIQLFTSLRVAYDQYFVDRSRHQSLRRAIYTINHHTVRMLIFYHLSRLDPPIWRNDLIDSVIMNWFHFDSHTWGFLHYLRTDWQNIEWVRHPYDFFPRYNWSRYDLCEMTGFQPEYMSTTTDEDSGSDIGSSIPSTPPNSPISSTYNSSSENYTPLRDRLQSLIDTVMTCPINQFNTLNISDSDSVVDEVQEDENDIDLSHHEEIYSPPIKRRRIE